MSKPIRAVVRDIVLLFFRRQETWDFDQVFVYQRSTGRQTLTTFFA